MCLVFLVEHSQQRRGRENSMRRSLCGSSFVLLCIFPRLANGFIATAVSRVGCLARRGVIASLPKSSENNVRLGVHDQQRVSRTTVMGSRGESRSDALKRVGFSIAGALAISISPSNAAARTTEELVRLAVQHFICLQWAQGPTPGKLSMLQHYKTTLLL